MCEGEIVENESYEVRKGTIVYKNRPPLDVRIVAYFSYFWGFFTLVVSLLLGAGLAKPASDAPWRVFFGTTVLANGTTQGIYVFCTSCCTLFCAWGLMRRVKLAWWLTVLCSMYYWAEAAVSAPGLFSQYPVNTAIGAAISISEFAWLWYRRELYGVHLAASHAKK
jgi:hypothetical protein